MSNRRLFVFLFYIIMLMFILNRAYNHLLLSQLEQPMLKFVDDDLSYWLLFGIRLSQFLVSNSLAPLIFDIAFAGSAFLCLIFKRSKILPAIFSILLFIYIITSYGYLNFHKHNLVGPLIFSFAFWAVNDKSFEFLLKGIRYYTLFVYFSSGFWKFFRGLWNADGHFIPILKNDALAFLIHNPDSHLAKLISWMIKHPEITDVMMQGNMIFQLSFIIGFFTRKFDWLFFFGALSFHIMSLLLLRAFFLEFAILLLTLLPLRSLYYSNKLQKRSFSF